ncbi:hypothetical protein R83H12_00397 [Fibrobacteria bacterium R8-3-H12]
MSEEKIRKIKKAGWEVGDVDLFLSPEEVAVVDAKFDLSEDIIKAHKYSSNHKASLKKDDLCGCFYCLKIFKPNEITEWTDEESGGTALCPYCEIDSVIGKKSGYPITEEFLRAMKKHWFEEDGEELIEITKSKWFKEAEAKTTPGDSLRAMRTLRGMKQNELAKKISVTPQQISDMEKGRAPIGKKMAMRIGEALNFNYKHFL